MARPKKTTTGKLYVHEKPVKVTDPEPVTPPVPEPVPAPEPAPAPEPVHAPEPSPETEPAPEPVHDPEPAPAPEPTPAPAAGAADEKDLFAKIGSATPPPDESKKKPSDKLFEVTRKKKKRGESSPDSTRIEGYILLIMVDTVFPFAFAGMNNLLDKRIKIQAEQLTLNEQEFNKLEPLADQAADYLSLKINPVAAFLVVSTLMYGNNLMSLRMSIGATLPKEKPVKTNK